jgi:hypothetical protein
VGDTEERILREIVSPEHLNIFVSGDVFGYNFGALYLLGAHSIKRVE